MFRNDFPSERLEQLNTLNPLEAPLVQLRGYKGLFYQTPWGHISVECVEIGLVRYMLNCLRSHLNLSDDYKFDIVLSHPGNARLIIIKIANYLFHERVVTKAIGYAAGANSVTLLAESSASILFNLMNTPHRDILNTDGIHVGVDIGGGTTDITVVKKIGGHAENLDSTQFVGPAQKFTELATLGIPKDGGEHIDSLLVFYCNVDTSYSPFVGYGVELFKEHKVILQQKENYHQYYMVRRQLRDGKHALSEVGRDWVKQFLIIIR
jgi:hypothetical protein